MTNDKLQEARFKIQDFFGEIGDTREEIGSQSAGFKKHEAGKDSGYSKTPVIPGWRLVI